MLEQCWESYRGWAKCARDLKRRTRNWASLGLLAASASAIFGTWSAQMSDNSRLLAILSAMAALAAVIPAWLRREAVQRETQSRWLRARCIAESIRSECYRFAAQIAPYDTDNADEALAKRIDQIEATANDIGLSPSPVAPLAAHSVPSKEAIPPTRKIDTAWYLVHRLEDRRAYSEKVLKYNSRIVWSFQALSMFVMLLAALGGILTAATKVHLAAWIGVATTVAVSISALGIAERSRMLATEAAKMVNRLNQLRRAQAVGASLVDLVGDGEALLVEENARWLTAMSKFPITISKPPMSEGSASL
jgi:hypothetical protein